MEVPDRLAGLRPVYWNPERSAETCAVCTTPVSGYSRCYQCNAQSGTGNPLANVVAPITYAVDDSQAMRDLYNYKTVGQEAHDAQVRLFTMLHASLALHLPCLIRAGRGEMVVTTVPSSKGRQGDHPLREAMRMFSRFPQPHIEYVGPANLDAAARRVLAPSRFEVAAHDVAGKHVLLLDDTWVTGAHMQSCASVLQSAGAAWVTAVPLGRMLKHRSEVTAAYLSRHKVRVFNPGICPLTGMTH